MKRTLQNGSEIEVYGPKHLPYRTPELILCRPNCPFLYKPIGKDIQLRCLLGGESFQFPLDAIQTVQPGSDRVPYRTILCLELDPTPKELDTLWTLIVADIYRERRVMAH